MKVRVRAGFRIGLLVVVMAVFLPGLAAAVCSSGGVVSTVNDCIPGGKGALDCFLEWSVTPVPPLDSNGFPTKKVECMDNTACDLDSTPGQCTFSVGVCVNVTDSRFTCTPTDATTYELKKPSERDATKAHKNPFNRNNRKGLDQGLDALIPTGTGNVCTPESLFVVPLKKGIKKGKGQVKLRIIDATLAKDTDTLKLTCLPNPVIATLPIASARQIASSNELIGGQVAYGRVGDWLIENDKARFIIRDVGRDFSFMLTYGGHLMDADLQRKSGPIPWGPPYPAGRDAYMGMTPLINISSTDNPTSIVVVNDGASGGAALLRTTGPDDLFDPIDPRVAIKGFSTSLSVPPSAIDNNIPTTIVNEYTLAPGDDFVEIETIITNTGGPALNLYIGDYANGGGQLEFVGPGLGFGEAAIRLGGNASTGEQTYDFLGWLGFGDASGISYGLIPQIFDFTSSFAQSGVVVPVYGQNLVGILLAPDGGKPPGILNVPGGGGMNSFKRWFAVSDNGMGRILDARHKLAARGELPEVKTGFVQGTVRVGGVPVDGARVTIARVPGDRTAAYAVIDVFETRDMGFFQGTMPKGDYVAMVKIPGYPYEGGGAVPLEKPISIASSTTVVDFDVPATGFVQVTMTDGVTTGPLSGKVSVVGLQSAPDPGISENAVLATVVGNLFGYDAREKVVIHGVPQVRFAGPSGDTGVFAVPPGTYQFAMSHGPEYSVSKQTLAVVAGSPGTPQLLTAALVPVVDTTGFISSDYHVHLINSPDSVITKNERIVTMLAEGVDYFVASDHDFLTDLTADVAALGASSLVKTAISDEITYFDSGHFGAYPLDLANPASVTNGAIDWGDASAAVGLGYPSDLSYDLSVDDMAFLAKGGPYNATVVQANHFNSGTLGYFRVNGIDTTTVPPQSSTAPAMLRQDPALTNLYSDELTALELWIESSRGQNALALGENMGDWFNMLNNFDSINPELRKAATFDSDTHSSAIVQAGGPRTMVASATDAPGSIVPGDIADNVNDGRSTGTNGPFMRVTITGSAAPPARHALGNPRIVDGSGGSATVSVDIQSPDWAEFDLVEIFVSNVPSCTTTPPNFVGGVKKVCPPVANFSIPVVPTPVVLGNGGTRLTAAVSQPLTITQDSWVVVVVRGRDNISRPLFPMNPQSILPRACSLDPCRACGSGLPPCGFAGSCTVNNQTFAELTDGNLNQCGVLALAIANPLFIDFDGGGYKGVALP